MKQETIDRRLAEVLKYLSDNPEVEGLWFSSFGGWGLNTDKSFSIYKTREEIISGESATETVGEKTNITKSKKDK